VSGNGGILLGHLDKRNGTPKESQLTFVFSETGDLARIDGTASMQQLLFVAFEATQLAASIRAGLQMQQAQASAELESVKANLEREQHGRK